jgi:hypothetical protein
MSELDDARRTIQKAEDVLESCLLYFSKQAEMNAAAHLALPDRVMHPPIHGAVAGVLYAIKLHRQAYPDA